MSSSFSAAPLHAHCYTTHPEKKGFESNQCDHSHSLDLEVACQ